MLTFTPFKLTDETEPQGAVVEFGTAALKCA